MIHAEGGNSLACGLEIIRQPSRRFKGKMNIDRRNARGHRADLYNAIGVGYAQTRRTDPFILAQILAALGPAQCIANIGAGAGSYEPHDRTVIAVEPSTVMLRQRPPDSARVVQASANALPFPDQSFDAAMSVLSLHHWHPDQKHGLAEMRRIARDKIVLVTIDPRVSGRLWLIADYLPELAALDHQTLPLPETLCAWAGGAATIEVVPVRRDTPDWSFLSFWAHPERVFDPRARAGTSGFARQDPAVIDRLLVRLRHDLECGLWDARYGALRNLETYDAGLRLITVTF